MSSEPRWPAGKPGPEAMFHGQKGDKGERGEKGEPGMTSAAKRAFITLTLLILAIAAAGLLLGASAVSGINRQEHALRDALRAQCQFDSDIGSAPIAVNPGTQRASKLGISIVVDARQAWRGLGCPGNLPPITPSARHWAHYYHLPAY